MVINCQVVEAMDEWVSCCSSCHYEDDEDLVQMAETYPPDKTGRAVFGKTMAIVCCDVHNVIDGWTRDDWARACWTKRRMMREENE